MAFSVNTNKRTAMSEINVTPLVDVMLVLLIIFMVTAPMMQEGVSVQLPQAKGTALQKEQDQGDVVIAVSGPGNIFLNEVPVKEDQLQSRVLEAAKDGAVKDFYLRADKNVPYGTVVRIMALLKEAGVANLGMITTPVEERAPTR